MADLKFEVVRRPAGGMVSAPTGLIKEIMDTLGTDKAVQIELGDTPYLSWQQNVRAQLAKHGIRMRSKYNKLRKIIIVWAEKPKGQDQQEVQATKVVDPDAPENWTDDDDDLPTDLGVTVGGDPGRGE